MEQEIQRTLRQPAEVFQGDLKKIVNENFIASEDVLFHWCLVSAGWDTKVGEALLPLIAVKFMTIRGFAFASTWVEQNKLHHKKNTQKSKGVRRHLL